MILIVQFWYHFRRPLMVLKNAFVAALCIGSLASSGLAMADEYRPDEFLGLDLSQAVLSPKRLGPDAKFAPVPIEARADRADPKADRKIVRTTRIVAHKVRTVRVAEKPKPRPPARVKLARRHSNPLDAQAADTRIQTWPCRSGGICNWQR